MAKRFQDIEPYFTGAASNVFHLVDDSTGHCYMFPNNVSEPGVDGTLVFAARNMIAANFWSLPAPAIEMFEEGSHPAWLLATAVRLAHS
jgi:hypothetical protein